MTEISLDFYISSDGVKNPTIAHVKEWIEKVNSLNLPDDYPLYDLEIGLSYTIDPSHLNPILCGDCSPHNEKSDIIISTHTHP
jgi:hypothetical protein